MKHYPNGSRPNRLASSDWFTGRVWQEPIVETPEPARLRAVSVRFEPGARTHWHTHPLGQTLHVVSGFGRAREEGGPLIELRPGDTLWIPPGVRHWHGGGPDTAMTHIAMQEGEGGSHITWMEPVADEDYLD